MIIYKINKYMTKSIPVKRVTTNDSKILKKTSVKDISKKHNLLYKQRYVKIRQLIQKLVESGAQTQSFYIYDPQSATERINLWRNILPRVEIFFAVKTNPDQKIIDKCIE